MRELSAVVAQFGLETVSARMRRVHDNAEESVRRMIAAFARRPANAGDGRFDLEFDNGARIRVRITVDAAAAREATLDLTGASAHLPGNFNVPKPVAMAAVLCVFRMLVDDDMPLNACCLKPLQVIVPAGCMLNPRLPAPATGASRRWPTSAAPRWTQAACP